MPFDMLSEIIKGSPTSCSFLWFQKIAGRPLCDVASVSAGFCVSTIERLREWVDKVPDDLSEGGMTVPIPTLMRC